MLFFGNRLPEKTQHGTGREWTHSAAARAAFVTLLSRKGCHGSAALGWKQRHRDELRQAKYSDSRFGEPLLSQWPRLGPTFTSPSGDWLFGTSSSVTAARLFRICTGFHAPASVHRRQQMASPGSWQDFFARDFFAKFETSGFGHPIRKNWDPRLTRVRVRRCLLRHVSSSSQIKDPPCDDYRRRRGL